MRGWSISSTKYPLYRCSSPKYKVKWVANVGASELYIAPSLVPLPSSSWVLFLCFSKVQKGMSLLVFGCLELHLKDFSSCLRWLILISRLLILVGLLASIFSTASQRSHAQISHSSDVGNSLFALVYFLIQLGPLHAVGHTPLLSTMFGFLLVEYLSSFIWPSSVIDPTSTVALAAVPMHHYTYSLPRQVILSLDLEQMQTVFIICCPFAWVIARKST